MLSKNNWQEQFRKQEPKRQQFTIKKLTVGVASVLIGFTFMGMSASADTDTPTTATTDQSTTSPASGSTSSDSNSVPLKTPASQTGKSVATPASQSSVATADSAKQENEAPKSAATPAKTDSDKTSNTVTVNSNSESGLFDADQLSTNLSQKAKEQQLAQLYGTSLAAVPATATPGTNVTNPAPTDPTYGAKATKEGVKDYSGFLSALRNSNTGTITLDQDIDFSNADLKHGVLNLQSGKWERLNDKDIARTVVIDGQGKYTLKMGDRYIATTDANQSDSDNWNIVLKDLTLQTTSDYGPFYFSIVGRPNVEKDYVTFDNVKTTDDSHEIVYSDGVNTRFYGNNDIKSTISGNSASFFVNSAEVVNGTTTINSVNTKSSDKGTNNAAILISNGNSHKTDQTSNVVVDDGASLTVNTNGKLADGSTNKNEMGIRFQGFANGKSIDEANAGVVRVGQNANLTINAGEGASTAIQASHVDVQDNGNLTINTLQNSTGKSGGDYSTDHTGTHFGVITLGLISTPKDGNNEVRVGKGANLTIKRTSSEASSPLISFGPTGVGAGYTYNVDVNGGTLDLQDSARDIQNSGDKAAYPDNPYAGLITMWGTSSNDTIQFNNPEYINLQRTNDGKQSQEVGSLIRMEGSTNHLYINNPASVTNGANIPFAQWDPQNTTNTPSYVWYLNKGDNQNQWGDYSSWYTKNGKDPAAATGANSLLNSGHNTYTFGANQGGGTFNDENSLKNQAWYMNQMANHLNYWEPQRIAMGSKLTDHDVKIKDTDQYEPKAQTIKTNTQKTLADLAVKDGIKDLIGPNGVITTKDSKGNVVPDLSAIDWNKTHWYNATKSNDDGTDQALWEERYGKVSDTNKPSAAAVDKDGKLTVAENGDNNKNTATIVYTDGTVDFVNIPIQVTTPLADQYTPAYKGITVKKGESKDTEKPSFTKADGTTATALDGTTYALTKDAPAWATISNDNKKTGIVTVKPGTDATPGVYNVPVTVTYSDDSTDSAFVPVVVTDPSTQGAAVNEKGAVVVTTNPVVSHKTSDTNVVRYVNDAIKSVAVYTYDKDGKLVEKTDATAKATAAWKDSTVTSVVTGSNTASADAKAETITATFESNTDAHEIAASVDAPTTLTLKGATATDNVQSVTRQVGALPKPSTLVNTADLTPANNSEVKTVTWKDNPSIDKTGKVNAVASIIFKDDNTTLDVPVSFNVVANEADTHEPTTQMILAWADEVKDEAKRPAAKTGVKNSADLDKITDPNHPGVKTKYEYVTINWMEGKQDIQIDVTYPDGSEDKVDTQLVVDEKPTIVPTTIKSGDTFNPTKGVSNFYDKTIYGNDPAGKWGVPTGVTMKGKTPTKPGVYNIPATVTYRSTHKLDVTLPLIVTGDNQTAVMGDHGAVVVTTNGDVKAHETTATSQDVKASDAVTSVQGYKIGDDGKIATDATNITVDLSAVTWATTPNTTVETATAAGKKISGNVVKVDLTNNDAAKEILGTKNGVVSTSAFDITAKGAGAKQTTTPVSVALDSALTDDQFSALVDNNIPTTQIASHVWQTKPDKDGKGGVIRITFTDKAKGEPTYLDVAVPASNLKMTTETDNIDPTAQDIKVWTDDTTKPDAKTGIGNTADLDKVSDSAKPDAKTTYAWTDPTKVAKDIKNPGKHVENITVTYPDGSQDTIDTNVFADEKPKTKAIEAGFSKDPTATLDPSKGITNFKNGQAGYPSKVEWITKPDLTKTGEQTVQAKVTYPDGNSTTADLTVNVTSLADKYDPQGGKITIYVNHVLNSKDAEKEITNKDTLVDNQNKSVVKSYSWDLVGMPVETSSSGDGQPGIVVVTYTDGSTDNVNVLVSIMPQNQEYQPITAPVKTTVGVLPEAKTAVNHYVYDPNYTQLDGHKGNDIVPDDDLPIPTKTTISWWGRKPDVSKPGVVSANVRVKYQDNTPDNTGVNIYVDELPTIKPIVVHIGDTVDSVKSGITNLGKEDEAKDGYGYPTDITGDTSVDTSTTGVKNIAITVNYKDGRKTPVVVPVIVTDQDNQQAVSNEKGTVIVTTNPVITHKTSDKNVADAKNAIKSVDVYTYDKDGNLNKNANATTGSTVTWVDNVTTVSDDSATVTDQAAEINVTFKDGTDAAKITTSVDNVPTKVTLNGASAKEGTTVKRNVGKVPAASSLVDTSALTKENNSEVSKVTWKETPSIETTGKKNGTAIISFKDSSTLNVPVSFTVVDDAYTHTPTTKPVSTDKGTTPDAPSAVTNKSTDQVDDPKTKLPEGTKFEWNDPDKIGEDVKTPGKKTDEEIKVTYPDDSTETVKTDIVVNDPPQVTTLTAGKGTKVPDPTPAITNIKHDKDGKPVDGYPSKVTWTKEPDISTKGSHKGTVEVEYPDGTKKTETITVNVTDDASDYPVTYDKLPVARPSDDTPATGSEDPTTDKKMPEGTITNYKVTDGFKAPDGTTVTVDDKTGKATVSVTKDAPLGTFNVPVEVTYKDGTKGTANIPVSVTGDEHKKGEDIYYGDQTMTKFIKAPFDVHKTTGDASADAKNFPYSSIEKYDWDRDTGTYNKTATYTLSSDGKTYVSDKDSSDTIDAANIQLAWQDNYKLNTNADNFKSKTGDTLADSNEEITGSDDSIPGNSKYRYNIKISDYNTLTKLGLAPTGYNSWSNVYFNFRGATGKQNIPVNYKSEVPTAEDAIKGYLDSDSISGKTFKNGNVKNVAWAENGKPGTNGKFDADHMSGTVEFTFDNGTKLDVPVSFKTGSHVATSDSKENDDTNLYVTRNIKYDVTGVTDKDGKPVTAPETVKQTVHYVRDGYHNVDASGKDTSDITWNDWKLADGETAEFPEFDQIASFTGYTPSVAKVESANVAVSKDGTPENGTDVTVTYTKKANIPVDADDTNPAEKTITRKVTFTGVPDDQKDNYKDQTQEVKFTREDGEHHIGYKDPVTGKVTYNKWTAEGSNKWVAVDTPAIHENDGSVYTPTITVDGKPATSIDEVTVDPEKTKNSTVTVAYKETTIPIKADDEHPATKDVTRTIVDKKPAGDHTETQTVSFKRTDDKGNIGYTTVNADGTKTDNMNAWTVTSDKTGWDAYTASQKGYTASAVDENNHAVTLTDGVTVPANTKVTGDTSSTTITITYTKNDNIPVKANDEHPAAKEITRTVTFTGVPEDKQSTYHDVTQTVKFSREVNGYIGTQDPVTDVITYNPWKVVSDETGWAKVEAPTITEDDGSVYTPTITVDGKPATSIDEVTVDPEKTKNSTVTVAYKETTIPVPYKQGKDDMDEYIKRTINVNYPDSATDKTQPGPQVVHFTRKDDKGNAGYTTVDANGKQTTTMNDWHVVGSDEWAAYTALEVAGYTADPTQIDAKTVSSSDKDTTTEINYTANNQTATINFVNNADHNDIVHTQTVNGTTGQTIGLSLDGTGDTTKLEVPEGWTVVSGTNVPGSITFGSEPSQPQVVYIEHKKDIESGLDDKNKDNTDLRRQVTRKIILSVPGQKDQEIPQTVDLYRTKTVDEALKAEGKPESEYTTYGEWKSATTDPSTNFSELNVTTTKDGKEIAAGYTPTSTDVTLEDKNGNKFVLNASALGEDKQPVADSTVHVNYTAQDRKLTIHYVDKNNNPVKNNDGTSTDYVVTGKTGQPAEGLDIVGHVPAGWKLVDGEEYYKTYKFGSSNDSKTYVVEHKTTTTDGRNDKNNKDLYRHVTRTIKVTGDMKVNKPEQTQDLYFYRTKTVDEALKAAGKSESEYTTYTPWTSDMNDGSKSFSEVSIPADGNGYVRTITGGEIKNDKITSVSGLDEKGNPVDNIVVTVNYKKADQVAHINYVDNSNKKTISTQDVPGKIGDTVKLSEDGAKGTTKLAVPDGWEIVPGTRIPTEIPFGSTPTKDVTVYVAHKTEIVPVNKDNKDTYRKVTQTITEVPAGQKDSKTVRTTTVEFTRTGVKDLVTNHISWNEWKDADGSATHTIGAYNVQQVKGYDSYVNGVKDTNVASWTVTPDSKDQTDAITYIKQGSTPVKYNPNDSRMNTAVTRIINYNVPTGHDAIAPVTQKVEYVRDVNGIAGYEDPTTGDITWNPWQPVGDGEFPAAKITPIKGYDSYVGNKKMEQVPSAQVVEENGEPQNGATVTVDYIKQGNTPVPYKPGKDGVNDEMNKYVTRTITVKEPGKDPVVTKQTVHFTNEDANGNGGYTDPTTGKITYNTAWHIAGKLGETTGTWAKFDTPAVPGYTPSQAKVDAKNDVTVDTPVANVTITYTKNAEPTPETKRFTQHIVYKDAKGNEIKPAAPVTITGTFTTKTLATISAETIKNKIDSGMPAGWKIVGNYPTAKTISSEDPADIVVTVEHATHVVKPGDHGVDPTKDAYKGMFSHVTRTIDITNPDGTEDKSNTQHADFTRSAVFDDVTGNVATDFTGDIDGVHFTNGYSDWNKPSVILEKVATPDKTYNGKTYHAYVAGKQVTEIGELTVKPGDTPAEVDVIYSAEAPKDNTVYEPSYPEIVTTPGKTTTTEVQYDGGKPTDKVTYKITDGADVPSWVTVDPTTGTITTKTPTDTTTQTIKIPVTVTYGDGTSDQTTATIVVIATKDHVNKPAGPQDVVKNPDNLPSGTKVVWTPGEEPDPNKKGDQPTSITVTVPGQKPVKIPTVVNYGNPTDADLNTPKGKDLTVEKGTKLPAASEVIENRDKMPSGTTYEWKTPVDTTTIGDKPAVITVHYPDKSQEDVTITIHVVKHGNGYGTDAEKNVPVSQPITTPEGQVPDAKSGIKNTDELDNFVDPDYPDGKTTYAWSDPAKVAEDVKTPGEHTELIIVKYPDGTTDPVSVQVTVMTPTPEGQDITTNQGKLPNPADGIKNSDEMPVGAKYTWKVQPDVTATGDQTGVVEVKLPDGTTYDVTVTVHVNAVNSTVVKESDNNITTNNNSTMTPQANNSTVVNNVSAPANVKENSQKATNNSKQLPQTGNETHEMASLIGLSLASLAGLFGLGGLRKKHNADK